MTTFTSPATMELFGMINNSSAVLQNPIADQASTTQTNTSTARDQVDLQLQSMDPADPNYPSMRNVKTTLDNAGSQITALTDHTNTLIFGNNAGTVISGGLSSNLGIALSALTLNNKLAAFGQPTQGTTSSSDPCAIIGDFFNTLIGKGAELLNQLNTAIAAIMAPIQQLINQINTAITAGMQALRDAINSLNAQIQAVTAQISQAISDELNSFAKWLNIHLNFNLSSFLSGVFNNSCARLLLNAVTSQAGLAVLSNLAPAAMRPIRPFAGRMW